MVKRPRIASKPTPPPAADGWVKGGGIDPEIQMSPTPAPAPAPSPETEPEPGTAPQAKGLSAMEEKGKAYPHRISFDTDKAQYKRLKRASFEDERSMNEILREAVEDWLRVRNY